MMAESIFQQGNFFIGCNYWASASGINMWHDWDAQGIEDDFRRLSENGVQVLRVFPLWSDFQPLRSLTHYKNHPREVRMGEKLMPFTEAGKAGVDEIMVDRFRILLDLAQRYHFKLIVGLLVGWMSSRIYAPELLVNRNLLTDPEALQWEVRYVRYLVRRFKDHPAVAAWDLGNECNALGDIPSRASFYCWAAMISMAIRSEDNTHPVVSGMTSLRIEGERPPREHGELVDILTTHPYPLFTPHCDTDPLNHMKSALFATAETRYYADLSGKPAFVEEIGSLGPMVASEEISADYASACMFTLWAHDCRGFLWWCAHEQENLDYPPYDWNALERELGLFRQDLSPKKVMLAMAHFSKFVQETGIDHLPPPETDALCILSNGQDTWAAAFGAFILAKKAHMNLRYAQFDGEIPDSPVYMLPSVRGTESVSRHLWMDLAERVRNGATLYLSMDDCLLSSFEKITGLRVISHSRNTAPDQIHYAGENFTLHSKYRFACACAGAKILAENQQGDPAYTVYSLGKGKVYCLQYPIETISATQPGVTTGEKAMGMEKFYLPLKTQDRCASVDSATMGLTEHRLDENHRILAAINYDAQDQACAFSLHPGWKISAFKAMNDAASLENGVLSLPHHTGVVIWVER